MRSATRPDFLSLEDFAARACAGKPPEKRVYIAVLLASELLQPKGMNLVIEPAPVTGDPGHVVIRTLHVGMDKAVRGNIAGALARSHCVRVIGPFNCDGPVYPQDDWHRLARVPSQ
jgi:hypothetical protein